MKTISLDLRQRIIDSYDQGEGTREDIAKRYRVSLGLVAKLLHQRRRTGEITAQHHRSGRKPKLLGTHRQQLRTVLRQKPDATLRELHAALGVACSLQAIHYVLKAMGLTYKKRHSGPVSKAARKLPARGGPGGGGKGAWIRRG